MEKFKIEIQSKGELLDRVDWAAIPRAGEIVVLSHHREFEVKEVLHLMAENHEGNAGKVLIEVAPK